MTKGELVSTGFPGAPSSPTGVQAVIELIVRDALAKGPGDTLITNTEVRDSIGVGMGTVQRALDLLAERDALHTVARGHLGRRIVSVDLGRCWQAAGLAPVRVLLTRPGSVEHDSLESTIGDELGHLGVPNTLRHLAGGNHRLEMLRCGECDLAVVSAGTVDGLAGLAPETGSLHQLRLAPGTYYAPERLVVLSGAQAAVPPQRVAIDRDSFDHEALTLAQFPPAPGRTFVEVPYPEVPAFVLAGVADAGIWHITTSAIPPDLAGLTVAQMSGAQATSTLERLSGAVIVAWPGRPELRSVVAALQLDGLDGATRAAVQAEQDRAARLDRSRSWRAQQPRR